MSPTSGAPAAGAARRVGVIVVAGGSGRRFGGAKQFAAVAGISVVDRSLAVAATVADRLVLVVPPESCSELAAVIEGAQVDQVVAGGETRSASVRAGLEALGSSVDVVVVHDAVRPLASPTLFRAVVDAVVAGADAAVPGRAVSETVKRVGADGTVTETVDRLGLYLVQTPQAFRAGGLLAAHAGGGDATDDAALVEAAGGRVVLIPGEETNIKITHPHDIAVAEALLHAREGR